MRGKTLVEGNIFLSFFVTFMQNVLLLIRFSLEHIAIMHGYLILVLAASE